MVRNNNTPTNYNATNYGGVGLHATNRLFQIKSSILLKNLSLLKKLIDTIPTEEYERLFRARILDSRALTVLKSIYGDDTKAPLECNILHVAAALGYTSMARVIVRSHWNLVNTKTSGVGLTPLQVAILMRQTRTAAFLLKQESDVKHALPVALIESTSSTGGDIVNMIIASKRNAVHERIRGATPVFFAKTPCAVNTLIDKGANINQRDEDGWTPIMACIGNKYAPENIPPKTIGQIVSTCLRHGANIRLRGTNSVPGRDPERKITCLHAFSHGMTANLSTMRDLMNVYKICVDAYRKKRMNINPKTTHGNTPVLYFIKKFDECIGKSRNVSKARVRYFIHMIRMFVSYGANLYHRDRDGKSGIDHIKRLSRHSNFPSDILNKCLSNTNVKTIKNIHIPNNLNRLDPVGLNVVNINDAYIIYNDLLNKTIHKNGKNVRVKEVKTVYNASSLNGINNKGTGNLLSPMTRRRFTINDILRLKDVVPKNEMNRYKRNKKQ